MTRRRRGATLAALPLAGAILLGAGGCASSTPVAGAAPSSSGSVMRWTGSLKQLTLAATGTIGSATTSGGGVASSHGSVSFTPVADMRGRTKYDVSVTVPTLAGQQVAWALYTGPCNTPSPPVVAPSELPGIDLGAGGSGVARGEFSAVLGPATTYHVNVYNGPRATDVNNVLLCGKLTYSGPR